jgi:hypothetical protein
MIPDPHFSEVLRLAAEKVQKERHSSAELPRDSLLREVFNKYGVV